jgi:glutamate-1-semialdehyde aminotransferase
VAKTPRSGERFAINRKQRVDTRTARLLRPELRDVIYPIVGDRAEGAHVWDIDGNCYVDITMGIGVLLCGHSPDFIRSAIAAQLDRKIQNGPVAKLADAVAGLIADMTGHERVLFGLSGTASVSNALRVARAATGRQRFVMFSGSYHGYADQTLALPDLDGDPASSAPMAPGISESAVRDAIVLPYAAAAALETVRDMVDELAAVLVEPVQSRNPSLQPRDFLLALRRLTEDRRVPLIFDEVMTGFRAHPGGVQAMFGITPDLSIYGKCIGGGLPVSAVAGRASLLDCVDLGIERDFRGPTTFIGSTFDMHPLCLAASHAMLTHIKEAGGTLQTRLNDEVARLAGTLNAFFAAEAVPLTLSYFGSMFRFAWRGNTSYVYQPLAMDIFHLHLVLKGLYVWEGRTCFLSTAHTPEDIKMIESVVRESVIEMKAVGFLGESLPAARTAHHVELTAQQQRLLRLKARQPPSAPDWCVTEHVSFDGALDTAALEEAVRKLVARHDALRSVVPRGRSVQVTDPYATPGIAWSDMSAVGDESRQHAAEKVALAAVEAPFDLETGPLLRVCVVRTAPEKHHLIVCCHHIIVDGWSMGIMLDELASLYAREMSANDANAGVASGSAVLADSLQFGDFAAHQANLRNTKEWTDARLYWLDLFREPVGGLVLPLAEDATALPPSVGGRISFRLEAELAAGLERFGREQRLTAFMVLFGTFALHLHALSGQDRLVCGTPVAARFFPRSETIVGYCAHFLPIVSTITSQMSVRDYFEQQNRRIITAFQHQNMPLDDILQVVSDASLGDALPFDVAFNMDPPVELPRFGEMSIERHPVPSRFALVDYRLDVGRVGRGYWLDYDYRCCRFGAATIQRWHLQFTRMLRQICSAPQAELRVLLDPDPAAARFTQRHAAGQNRGLP